MTVETIAPGGEVLRTERLILRRFTFDDVDAYHELFNQPAVEATLIPGPASKDEAGRHIAMIEGHWPLSGFSFFAVIERSTKLLVGRAGPWKPYGMPGIEIGWTMHPRRWRRGYAFEAAVASARWTLERFPDEHRVIHTIAPTNVASQAVARKIGGRKSGEQVSHPLAGPLDIWETPRERFVSFG